MPHQGVTELNRNQLPLITGAVDSAEEKEEHLQITVPSLLRLTAFRTSEMTV